MTKEQLALKVLSQWWGCVRDSEVEEFLNGAGGIDPEDVKALYPNWGDYDNEDYDPSEIVESICNEVGALLKKLKEANVPKD